MLGTADLTEILDMLDLLSQPDGMLIKEDKHIVNGPPLRFDNIDAVRADADAKLGCRRGMHAPIGNAPVAEMEVMLGCRSHAFNSYRRLAQAFQPPVSRRV